jgi:hypothetical protein
VLLAARLLPVIMKLYFGEYAVVVTGVGVGVGVAVVVVPPEIVAFDCAASPVV